MRAAALIIAVALSLAPPLLVPAVPAGAQSSLLDSAKDALKGLGGSGGGLSGSGGALSAGEIASGLSEALRVATGRTVEQVGTADGYNADPAIHIPLPGALKDVQKGLQMVGLSSLADDLELRLNRAAETAAPEAKEVFWDSIKQMSWDDAQQILDGPDDAATQYFRRTMSSPLKDRMKPIVDDALAGAGAIKSYDEMMGAYAKLPMMPDVKADITDYTLDKALDGLFHYLAVEEAKIRQNPAARSTELLQKVFGA
ncbi:MAG: DUF4197 domain-containing protein [Kiloniellales bacterium]